MKGRGMYRRSLDSFKRLFDPPTKKIEGGKPRPVFSTEGSYARAKAVERISYVKGNTKTLHGRHGRGLDYSKYGTRSERLEKERSNT